jgi:hypothetical protein
MIQDKQTLEDLKAASSLLVERHQMDRATETGAWLTVIPDQLNGTDLSADEFRDSLLLHFRLTPHSLPHRCEGCQQRFSVEHAMTCKKGGLILLCHNDLSSEWQELCAQAPSPSAVSDEPLIHNGQGQQEGGADVQRTEPLPEIRGDVSAHGFWTRGTTVIFDIRVRDTECPSQRGSDPGVSLKCHEVEKKWKYLVHCECQRKHFTPLVFSVDVMMGMECDATRKRLVSCLATLWKWTYSEVCSFVRSRLAIALVQSASWCLWWY